VKRKTTPGKPNTGIPLSKDKSSYKASYSQNPLQLSYL